MNATIAIPTTIATHLHQHLFQNKLEQGAFLFAGYSVNGGELKLGSISYYCVPPDGWDVRRANISPDEGFRACQDNAYGAQNEYFRAIDCHSHPHANDDVWFSPSDVAGVPQILLNTQSGNSATSLLPQLFGVSSPSMPLCGIRNSPLPSRLLLSRSPDTKQEHTLQPARGSARREEKTDSIFMNDRYSRQELMFGKEGQRKIETKKIGLVGGGGLGSLISQGLAYLGAMNVAGIDDDKVDRTTLNRLVGAYPTDIGRLKVDVLKDHALKIMQ